MSHSNDLYGADRGLLHSVLALDKDQYATTVLLPSDSRNGELAPKLKELRIEHAFEPLAVLRRMDLTPLRLPALLTRIVASTFRIFVLLGEKKIDAVYSNSTAVVTGTLAGKMRGIPVLQHYREIWPPGPFRRCYHWFLALTVDKVICVSDAVRQTIIKDCPSLTPRCVVVHNGVDEPTMPQLMGPGPRQQLNLSEDTPLIGIVGRLNAWKGQDDLVRAAHHVHRIRPDARFIAVGSSFAGQEFVVEQLRQLIRELNLVDVFQILGHSENPAAVYRDLEIAVLASKRPEPFGRVTVEAMMQGCVVIGTEHGGTSEIVQHGQTGLLVPPSNPVALAEAILLALGDAELRNQLGRKAAASAKNRFSVDAYQSAVRNCFTGVLTRAD